MFRALLIEKTESGTTAALREVEEAGLPQGTVTVDVLFSTINYKDSLAITGKAPVVRQFPMVPGIDFAGTVASSEDPRFAPGDEVVLTGWGVGEKHWGGLGEKARVDGDWLLPLPAGLSAEEAMGFGTAGLTAALAVEALEAHGVEPGRGEVAVSGATGGVGSVAVALLAKAGFRVVAITGKAEAEEDYLKKLGAAAVLPRSEFEGPAKPLGKERWAGAVDTVGGTVLAHLCAGTAYRGTVAACGMAGSLDFPGSVAPFILRGVTLAGIDSVQCPRALREAAWKRLAEGLPPILLEEAVRRIGLSEVPAFAAEQIAGRIRGRVVVDVRG